MSINHYSSDQFPEPHLYWPNSQYMMMESSSSNHNKSAFFSHSIPNNTNTTSSGFWATPSQLYHHSNAVAGGGVGASSTAAMFNLNNNEDEEELVVDEQLTADDADNINNNNLEPQGMEIPKEPLFEKPLTPSDVGKLNRLVIPKQHAEKYFPLSSGGSGGGDSGEKGFLLSFEDEMGKSWRFRYSYWNSSQSYVLTKGWSRFVKEKRLDAGDFVLFSRHRADAGRLFIGWRRRNSGVESGGSQPVGGGSGYNRVFYPAGNPYPSQQHQGSSSSHPYQPDCLHAGSVLQNQTSTAAVAASGHSKRLRLFGVNLECQADESESSTPTEGSPMSSQGGGHHHHHHHQQQQQQQQQNYQHQYYSTHHNHMGQDINFSTGDHVYRQG